MYIETWNFIRKLASERIEKKARESGLSYSRIYDTDRNMIRWIVNNECTKKNPTLIPPKVASTLVEKLDFKNIHEVYWGEHEEIEVYARDLFKCVIKDIFTSEKLMDLHSILDHIIIDYVPYAKWSAFYTIYEKDDFQGGMISGLSKAKVLEEKECARELAIQRLYNRDFGAMFIEEYLRFTDAFFVTKTNNGQNRGFSCFNKRFAKFVTKELVPLFINISSDDTSLGKRVYALITNDILDYCVHDMETLGRSPEANHKFMTLGEIEDTAVLTDLYNGAMNYIMVLEQAQKDFEGTYWFDSHLQG